MFSPTIHNNTSLPRDVVKSIAEPPDLPQRHFLMPGTGIEGVSQKIKYVSVPKNIFELIKVLESIAEPPELPRRHLFEPGAGFEGGIQKSIT